MRFSTVFSVALLSLAKLIVADSEQFGLVTIRSGSALQYAGVYNKDGALYFGSGDSLSGVITDDGKLKFTDNTYAVVGDDGYLTASSDESTASTGFSIKSGYLAYADKNGFYGVLEDSSYKVATKSESSDSLPVAISARGSDGQTVPDFSADGSSSSSSAAPESSSEAPETSSAAPETSSAAPETTTVAPETTSKESNVVQTVAAVSQIGDGQIQATTGTQSVWIKTESGNNAGKVTFGAGAGIAAIAALLL
ncbi:Cwp1 [Kluyveromyces lactis]|nr:Cwp1 [Kluyveromyces lactis]